MTPGRSWAQIVRTRELAIRSGCGASVTGAFKVLLNDDRGAYFRVFIELTGHLFGHAHTAMRGGIPWQEAGAHSYSVIEAHEVGHRCVYGNLVWSGLINTEVGVVVDHFVGDFVFDDAITG